MLVFRDRERQRQTDRQAEGQREAETERQLTEARGEERGVWMGGGRGDRERLTDRSFYNFQMSLLTNRLFKTIN